MPPGEPTPNTAGRADERRGLDASRDRHTTRAVKAAQPTV